MPWLWTKAWGSNGNATAQFRSPVGVVVDPSGHVFVADTGNDRIQKFDKNGTFVSTWGGFGTGNGQFKEPNGLAVDGGGHVFVADTSNNRIQKFDDGGTFLIAWGSGGGGNGHFSDPTAVAVDTAGNVFVTDLLNERVQAFDGNGRFLTTWTAAGSEQLDSPHGVAVDGRGDVFVADTNSHRIEKFSCPTPPPYDIAGHWSGMERQGHMALASISADFTSLSAKKFTGVFTGEALSCTVSGKHLKVFKAQLKCSGGIRIVLRGKLDTATQTIAGTFRRFEHGKREPGGTFTLTKVSA